MDTLQKDQQNFHLLTLSRKSVNILKRVDIFIKLSFAFDIYNHICIIFEVLFHLDPISQEQKIYYQLMLSLLKDRMPVTELTKASLLVHYSSFHSLLIYQSTA